MTQVDANETHVAAEQQAIVKRRSAVQVVDPDHVLVTYSFKMTEKSPSYEKTTLLDFSDVSREQLLEICCGQGLVVRLQRMLRDKHTEDVAKMPQTFREVSVLNDIIGAGRSRLPSDEVAIRLLARKHKIDESELRKWLESNVEVLQDDNTTG